VRLIGYCRQSTQRQFLENQGLERYIEALKSFGVSPDNIYWDIESGSSKTRKGLNIVLGEIRAGKFDCLVVPSQDRLTRDVEQWESIAKEFKELGIAIVSLDRGELDMETPAGNFSNTILAAAAAMTRQVNQYNSIQGHRHRRMKKLPLRACFGYLLTDGKLIPNRNLYKETGLNYQQLVGILIDTFLEVQTAAGTVRRMCDRFGTDRIGRHEHDFPHDHTSLIDWLKNPVLIGTLVYFPKKPDKRIEIPLSHEPLISDREFYTIQSILNSNQNIKNPDTLRNPLSGLIYCSCGSPMVAKSSGDKRYSKFHYVYCKAAYPICGKPQTCDRRTSHGLKVSDYVKAVADSLQSRSRDVAEWGASGTDEYLVESTEIKTLKNKIAQLKAIDLPGLSDVILESETKLNQLLREEYGSHGANQQIINDLLISTSHPDFWESVTNLELRDIFRDLVDRVVCDRGEIIVTLKF
jgi:DNA invertase Pin-like site-specific DNA recombinase